MKGFVEILSGIVRVGPEADGYGKPFEFAVAFSSVDGKTAMIKALVVKNEKTVGDFEYTRAVIEALRNVGLKIDWERVKPEEVRWENQGVHGLLAILISDMQECAASLDRMVVNFVRGITQMIWMKLL